MNTVLKFSYLTITFLPGLLFAYKGFIRDNSLDVNHVLNGDITKMDHMFINPSDYEESDNKEVFQNINIMKQNIDPMLTSAMDSQLISFDVLSNSSNDTKFDINDFNKIDDSLINITTRRLVYDDPEDYYSYREPAKKKELIKVGLQFLIHSRYKLVKAFKQREPLKSSKRYRLGYLFNKLRRIKYEMAKINDQAQKQTFYLATDSVLRFYEQFIRHHVDAKDLIEFIKVIDAEPDEELLETTTVDSVLEEENKT